LSVLPQPLSRALAFGIGAQPRERANKLILRLIKA
jgi:hypothetical protein